MESRSCVGH